MKEVYLFVPAQEYYMGFAIQIHPDGYFVFGREDTVSRSHLRFSTLGRAMAWIEKQV